MSTPSPTQEKPAETYGQPTAKKSMLSRAIDSFKPAEKGAIDPDPTTRAYVQDVEKGGATGADGTERDGRIVDGDDSPEEGGLQRKLSGRHLQMIALGGSIGTGLFVGSGGSFQSGGPGSVLIGFLIIGVMMFMVVNALGELAVVFPIQGSFSIYSSRFLHPSWGFAMGWNYALQWIVTLPTEITAAIIVIDFWPHARMISPAVWVSVLLGWTFLVNMLGVRGYGESEFVYSMIKVIAILGFIILAIIIDVGGAPDNHYYGVETWRNPGAFNNGFKGFCSVFINAAFAFSGTELVGLAAAETANPRKTLPSATKQVFWRVSFFYIISLLLVGFLVGSNNDALLNGDGNTASPFVIAIQQAQIPILPSIFNAVILIATLSVGNSATFATSRTLTALANYNQAPKFLSYVDREGRPMISLLIVLLFGCLGYISLSSNSSTVFDWLLALGGLSALFTWGSICIAHVRFRTAWARAGRTVEELPFRAAFGVWGSYLGAALNIVVIIATFYVALFPIHSDPDANTFFQGWLSGPLIIAFFLGHFAWFRDGWVSIDKIDLDSGRRNFPPLEELRAERQAIKDKSFFPRYYSYLC